MLLFIGWVAWKVQVNRLGSSDSLSLAERKEEFTKGEESSPMNEFLLRMF